MSDLDRSTVLVVDDNDTNIDILVEILADEYELMAATDGETALEIAFEELPEIILLDIMMPGMNGYEVCRRLKADKRTASIPVIFITALTDVEDETRGLELGAVDYITKPISPPIVLARVANHIALANQMRACEVRIDKQLNEIRKAQKDAVYLLGRAGHYNDDDKGAHVWRMANYAKALAKAAGWPLGKQNMLLLAAPMHDTGKIAVPDAILQKEEPLTPEEKSIMRKHPIYGHKILSTSQSPLFRMASEIALYHHEHWDGGGYPKGVQGEDIPESARIVAIADVFDALTMQRPYKEAWSVERALAYLKDMHGHFEPRLVAMFMDLKDELDQIRRHWNRKEKNKTF